MKKLKALGPRAKALLEKWKWPGLMLALGAVLLLWPSGADAQKQAAQPETQTVSAQAADDTRSQLERLLSGVEGVGRVQLMLTFESSEEVFYQTDVRVSGETREQTTVFSSGASSQKTPVVTKTAAASYLGAVVVCDGADSAAVRLRITQAVSALTGLGSDKISVIKMKRQ